MLDRGLFDLDRLEATLEGGVLSRGACGTRRAWWHRWSAARPSQHRLEDAGRVDGAFGGAGTDEGVELVDEQDDVAAGLDLLEDLLEALLEIAAVAGTGDQGAEVEGVELLAPQGVGHLVVRDHLGEALDDGGLADAGLTDQDRVVLGAADSTCMTRSASRLDR